MLNRRHRGAHHLPGFDVDRHPLDHRDNTVAWKRILPCLQDRVAGDTITERAGALAARRRGDQVHLPIVALILLLRRDHPAVSRPEGDGAITVDPPGVVRGVAEILDPVRGKLPLLAAGHILDPEIPVVDEHAALPVGRQVERLVVRRYRGAAATSTTAAPAPATAKPAGRHCGRRYRPGRECAAY